MDENGKLCLDKAKLIVYSHGEYLALGKKLGTFGYSVRKKKPTRKPTNTSAEASMEPSVIMPR